MDEEHLNPNAILATLGCERPGSIERVSGGRDTAIFRVELGGELHALRVFRSGRTESRGARPRSCGPPGRGASPSRACARRVGGVIEPRSSYPGAPAGRWPRN
jgi:hypothetical protein